jgi:hypothetical protein
VHAVLSSAARNANCQHRWREGLNSTSARNRRPHI